MKAATAMSFSSENNHKTTQKNESKSHMACLGNQKVADSVAKEIGLTDAWGSLLPEEKVQAIKKLRQTESKLSMVGDGVNDAPAMAHSIVGIALGTTGSDVALETANIALMADKLETLPFAKGLSRKAKGIIKHNLWVSLGVVALLIPSTIFALANMACRK